MRQLGNVGPEVSALGIGCMPMSGTYGTADDAASISAIHRALELGINLLDTSNVYGDDGHNELLVGRAIRDRRDKVVLATKFGIVRSTDGRPGTFNGRPEYVRECCDASLKRLGVDHIDLYQQHRVDPDTPIEETVGALKELVQAGKVRFIGLSEAQAPDIRRAAAVHPISSLQSEYSILERSIEGEIFDTCTELGIGILPFSPLQRGLLTGSLTAETALESEDFRTGERFPRVGPTHLPANLKLVEVVREVATAHGASMSQVAIAWLLTRGAQVVPIPGTKRVKYVEDLAGSPDVKLTTGDLTKLDALYDQVQGARYGSGQRVPDWVSPPVQ